MIGEQETGPLTRVELGVELATGAITPQTLVWKEGMINWLPGARIPELEALFKNPPRSPRAAGARPPPLPKKQDKGMGLSDFDTSHFRLADLQPEEGGATRQMEFDTGHFRLADLQADDDGQNRQMEFDTSHFRLADLKGAQGARALVPKRIVPKGMEAEVELPQSPSNPGKAGPRSALKQASTAAAKPMGAAPVAVRQGPAARSAVPPPPVAASALPAPASKAAPRPAPASAPRAPEPAARPAAKPLPAPVESDFDPNATAVDFRTLGELVHQQDVAQSLFETELVPAEAPVVEEPAADPHAAELSSWAAKELAHGAAAEKPDLAAMLKAKARAASPPPVPLPPEKSWLPTAVAIAGALALAVALVWYLLAD